jgi:hypothetical protein
MDDNPDNLQHLEVFQPGSKFSEGEEYLLSSLSAILSPLGICHLVYGPGSHENKDKESASIYPHKRFHLILWLL